jgi:hypothetical protein
MRSTVFVIGMATDNCIAIYLYKKKILICPMAIVTVFPLGEHWKKNTPNGQKYLSHPVYGHIFPLYFVRKPTRFFSVL